MEKYEALYHYFSNIKPNFWQLPSVSDSLYLKLQKFTHFWLFSHIGSAIFHHNKSENFPCLQNLKYAVNIFNLLSHHYSLVLVAACNILTPSSAIQISDSLKSSIKF